MTEAEWIAATDARPMLEFVGSKAGDRKLRLFGAACCRRIWDVMYEGCRPGIDAVERLAEGLAGDEVRHLTKKVWMGNPVALMAAINAVEWVLGGDTCQLDPTNPWQRAEACEQAQLLREFLGNPFRPVAFSTSWRTDTAVTLARQMYDSRDFSAMPILADALQDAGCDSADVLDHCRGPGPHVRGCWVVDLVLGKE